MAIRIRLDGDEQAPGCSLYAPGYHHIRSWPCHGYGVANVRSHETPYPDSQTGTRAIRPDPSSRFRGDADRQVVELHAMVCLHRPDWNRPAMETSERGPSNTEILLENPRCAVHSNRMELSVACRQASNALRRWHHRARMAEVRFERAPSAGQWSGRPCGDACQVRLASSRLQAEQRGHRGRDPQHLADRSRRSRSRQ